VSAHHHGYVTGGLRLRSRVYLLIAVGIVFPLLLMAAAGIVWMRNLDERVMEGRNAAASAAATHFDEEITWDLEGLQRLASALSAGFGERGDRAFQERAVRSAQELFRHRETIFLVDRARNVLAREPGGAPWSVPPEAVPLLDDVLSTGRPRLSGLVEDERSTPLLYELVPLRDWRGNVAGAVGGSFRPERREFDRMLVHLRRGQTGFAELVDSSGRILASTRRERNGRTMECPAGVAQLASARRAATEPCLECHMRRGIDGSDPRELMTVAPLATAPWAIVVRQAAREAVPTLGTIPWYAVLLGLALQVVVVGAFAWGAAESVTRPVAVLTGEAERIAAGELTAPIPQLGSDEVGRLGQALERMRESLRTSMERVEQANAQLEDRVEERTHALNDANAQLREREADRSQLLRKIITAQEDERKRIARELHDETSQSLAVLAMGLEAAQDAIRSGHTPRLDEVKAVAVRTLEDVHRLILDLRPSVLDDLGLLSAIRWYAERTLESRGLSVRCEFEKLDRRLPPELETALFRMTQETLTNIARHAHATGVLIQVGMEGDALNIEVEDDGEGFDPEAVASRDGRKPWGLLGIRERAEILGGTATIESAPGQGTRVLVRIPLPKEAAA
jgi:signal transduction histidine kinase